MASSTPPDSDPDSPYEPLSPSQYPTSDYLRRYALFQQSESVGGHLYATMTTSIFTVAGSIPNPSTAAPFPNLHHSEFSTAIAAMVNLPTSVTQNPQSIHPPLLPPPPPPPPPPPVPIHPRHHPPGPPPLPVPHHPPRPAYRVPIIPPYHPPPPSYPAPIIPPHHPPPPPPPAPLHPLHRPAPSPALARPTHHPPHSYPEVLPDLPSGSAPSGLEAFPGLLELRKIVKWVFF